MSQFTLEGEPATLRLKTVFCKNTKWPSKVGLAWTFFGQKIKGAHFCETFEECKTDTCQPNFVQASGYIAFLPIFAIEEFEVTIGKEMMLRPMIFIENISPPTK